MIDCLCTVAQPLLWSLLITVQQAQLSVVRVSCPNLLD